MGDNGAGAPFPGLSPDKTARLNGLSDNSSAVAESQGGTCGLLSPEGVSPPLSRLTHFPRASLLSHGRPVGSPRHFLSHQLSWAEGLRLCSRGCHIRTQAQFSRAYCVPGPGPSPSEAVLSPGSPSFPLHHTVGLTLSFTRLQVLRFPGGDMSGLGL